MFNAKKMFRISLKNSINYFNKKNMIKERRESIQEIKKQIRKEAEFSRPIRIKKYNVVVELLLTYDETRNYIINWLEKRKFKVEILQMGNNLYELCFKINISWKIT